MLIPPAWDLTTIADQNYVLKEEVIVCIGAGTQSCSISIDNKEFSIPLEARGSLLPLYVVKPSGRLRNEGRAGVSPKSRQIVCKATEEYRQRLLAARRNWLAERRRVVGGERMRFALLTGETGSQDHIGAFSQSTGAFLGVISENRIDEQGFPDFTLPRFDWSDETPLGSTNPPLLSIGDKVPVTFVIQMPVAPWQYYIGG